MIPIFRAKKLDSDEYVEGGYSDTFFLCMGDIQGHYISYKKINVVGREITLQESIDPTTISIHFPDMLDSKGNKIFASLQEDGKGGDIMQDDEYFGIAKYKDCQFVVEYEDCIDNIDNGNFEVIGIQQ